APEVEGTDYKMSDKDDLDYIIFNDTKYGKFRIFN
ncbi:hypothetical protein A3Q56_02304, partial [Intoshia linei]